jgi:hypothetical protein
MDGIQELRRITPSDVPFWCGASVMIAAVSYWLTRKRNVSKRRTASMVAYEPILLTFMDFAMIILMIIGLFSIPALLAMKEFRIAAKTALLVGGVIALNAAVHTAASLLHL